MNEVSALNRTLITDLNDDCLYDIFKRLSVRDQLNLLKTCDRFHFIIKQMIWRILFRETRTDDAELDQLHYDEYHDVFQHTTEFMEKLIVGDRHWFITTAQGCESICMELDFYMGFTFPRLTSLESNDHCLQDEMLHLLAEKCPQLEHLVVTSPYITGAYINKFRNLQELFLPSASLKVQNIRDIFESCKNLSHVNVCGCKNYMRAIVHNRQPRLHHLKVYKEDFMEQLLSNVEEFKNRFKLRRRLKINT